MADTKPDGGDSPFGPRSSGRRIYDQAPWWSKVISTSGIAGLIAVMLIVNQQRVAELDRKQKAVEVERLSVALADLHESIDSQTKSLNELKTEVLLLRQALRVQTKKAKVARQDSQSAPDELIWYTP